MPEGITAFAKRGKYIGALPAEYAGAFGRDFYTEQSLTDLSRMTQEEWKIRMEGQLCSGGRKFHITPYNEIRAFIQEELGDLFWEVEEHE